MENNLKNKEKIVSYKNMLENFTSFYIIITYNHIIRDLPNILVNINL